MSMTNAGLLLVRLTSLFTLVASFSTSTSTIPVITNPPRWSWDTLGSMAFVHSGQSKGYNSTDIATLTKFSMVQFDKKQGVAVQPDANQEDRFIFAGKQIKAADKGVQVLMYINALINFPAGRLYNLTDPSLYLKDATGKVLKLVGNTVFNLQLPAMRKLFVEDALYGMASGAFNGVFIDRANWAASSKCVPMWGAATCSAMVPGQSQLFGELTAALGEANITLAKETGGTVMNDWHDANAAMTSDTFCSHYCHSCNASTTPATTWVLPTDAQSCADSIATIANMSARGQLTQSHAMGPFDGPESAEARAFTMAAFLIGAGNLSFYSYANWANDCWELAGTKWWPEYDLPLGVATSPPNTLLPVQGGGGRVHRWKYGRNFSSGTTVYVDIATRMVEISWANSSRENVVVDASIY